MQRMTDKSQPEAAAVAQTACEPSQTTGASETAGLPAALDAEYVVDHSSDLRFLAYYAQASLSDETRGRFERVRDWALVLLAERGRKQEVFDVLDIGCGAGTQALLWAERGHRVRALDVNEPLVQIAVQRAMERGFNVDFRVGTATKLPFESCSADVVLLPELLEHVADWEACLAEAARVVRPGGLLYVSTTNKLCPLQSEFNLPLYSWYPASIKRWCVRKCLESHPHWANYARFPAVNWFTYYGLRNWLSERGFSSLDRFDVLSRKPLSPAARTILGAVRAAPPLRFLAQMMTGGSIVWAFKEQAE